MKFKKYKIKLEQGIDDLQSLYAFRGNSQGDETETNSIEQYKNSNGWLSFVFDCEMTEEAIALEIEKRKKANNKYLKELKRKGKYGKEYTLEVSVMHDPSKDDVSLIKRGLDSFKLIFLDFSKNNL